MVRARRICNVDGCPAKAGTGGRCTEHQQQANRRHWHRTRAYSSTGHRARFRPAVLKRDPICVLCNAAPSVVADHHPLSRAELVEAGLDPDDPRFGRGLCVPCHNQQTAERQPGGWNAPSMLD